MNPIEEINKGLHLLFPKEHEIAGYIELRLVSQNTTGGKQVVQEWFSLGAGKSSYEEVASAIGGWALPRQRTGGLLFNAYIGRSLRRKAGGSKREDVGWLQSVVADLDPVRARKENPATEEESLRAISAAVELLRATGVCGAILSSGNGAQVWLPCKRPTDCRGRASLAESAYVSYVDNALRYGSPNAGRLSGGYDRSLYRNSAGGGASTPSSDTTMRSDGVRERGLQPNAGIPTLYGATPERSNDTVLSDDISDLPRLIKLPGSISYKGVATIDCPYREVKFLEEYSVTTGDAVDLDPWIDRALDASAASAASAARPAMERTPTVPARFWVELNKDQKLRESFLGTRADLSAPPDRSTSEQDMALAAMLKWKRFTPQEAIAVLCSAPKSKAKNRPDYAELTVRKAYGL